MKVSVIGLWHLGSVTAACLAHKGFDVTGIDSNEKVIEELAEGKAPIAEPGLNELVKTGLSENRLTFSTDKQLVASSSVIWVTYDTPVDDNDNADTAFVENEIISLFPYLSDGSIVLVSSQLPVGSIAKLEKIFSEKVKNKKISFACSPENLRLGKAIDVFVNPDRIIVGVRNDDDRSKLAAVIDKLSNNNIWMRVESAEMTKHAVNAFLATSVVFINELAVLCEYVGADAKEVEQGLKSEYRIGSRAYLRPGSAFAGGTLARDVTYLVKKENDNGLSTVFFSSIIASNENHKNWVGFKLTSIFGDLAGKTIGLLGLTYKPGTDTLRRSTAIELCYWLDRQNVKIIAYDPALEKLPEELAIFIDLQDSPEKVINVCDAVVIATECIEFKKISAETIQKSASAPVILDANAFLSNVLDVPGVEYITIGRNI